MAIKKNKYVIQKAIATVFLGALFLLPLALPFCVGRVVAGEHQMDAANCPLEQLHETISHIDLMKMATPLVASVSGQQILLLTVFLLCTFSISVFLRLAVSCLYKQRCSSYIHQMSPWSFICGLLADGVMHPKIY